jgi:PAS domain S-box-containing protein
MKRRWTPTIRGGLVLLALLALLPALALQIYDGVRQRHHLIADATQEVLRAATSLAQVQARVTDGTRILLSTLAILPQVRRLDADACNALFASLLQNNPLYLNILMVNPDGAVVASGLPHDGVNLADRKHVQEALAADAFSAGEYMVSRMAFEPIFPFAFPVHDEAGALVGLLLTSVRLAAYNTMFDRLHLPQGSILGITDQAGVRLHYRPHSRTNAPGSPIRQEVWRIFSDGADTGVALLAGSDGHKRYYSWSKVRLSPDTPPYMIFSVGLPEEAVLAPARKAMVRNIVLLLGVTGLAIGLAWFVGGAIIARRLDRIADTAERIGQGDLTARTNVPHGDSGIGKVARTIDGMTDLLAEHDAARERALAALRQSQERMAHITMTMADWIWETDAEARFTHASDQVRRVLGYEPAELYGKSLYDFLAPEEAVPIRALFEAAKTRGEALRDLEYWFMGKDGRTRCLRSSGVPWHDETGAFRGYRGVSKDVTARELAEQAVRDSLRDKEILLKEIHHRVKNNLQIISGLLYLQEEHVHDPAALDAFRQSRHRIASMALIHEELYRSANLSRVCLGEYVRDLLPRLFDDASNGPRLAMDLRLDEARVPIEQAVPAGLVINELLTNAYKHAFIGRDQGLLGIAITEVDGMVEIEIRDDGPGLPAGLDLERTATLGMQLVGNLARQLRGSIEARNDGGAVLLLRFPKNA